MLLAAAALAQTPPVVVSLAPAHLDVEVDAVRTTAIEVTFDQPMSTGGWSSCGGGPAFPTCFAGEGIVPDVEVEVADGDLETRDPILERALELLREG